MISLQYVLHGKYSDLKMFANSLQLLIFLQGYDLISFLNFKTKWTQ